MKAADAELALIGFVLQPSKPGHIAIILSLQKVYVKSAISKLAFFFHLLAQSSRRAATCIPVIPAKAGIQDFRVSCLDLPAKARRLALFFKSRYFGFRYSCFAFPARGGLWFCFAQIVLTPHAPISTMRCYLLSSAFSHPLSLVSCILYHISRRFSKEFSKDGENKHIRQDLQYEHR